MVSVADQVVPAPSVILKLPTDWLVPVALMAGWVTTTTNEGGPAIPAAPAPPASPSTERPLVAVTATMQVTANRRNLLVPCFISCSLDLVFIATVVTSGLRSPGRTTRYI